MCHDLSPTDVISLGVDLKDREAQKTESGKHLIQTEMRRKFYEPGWVDAGNIIALQTWWSKEFNASHGVAVARCKSTSPQDGFMFPKGIS